MKLWVGKEKEGCFKDKNTLFVGDFFITLNDINKVYNKIKFEQIYFGAGKCTHINQDLVLKCLQIYKHCIITLEVDIDELHLMNINLIQNDNINFIVTISNNNLSLLNVMDNNKIQIKIQSLDLNKYISLCKLNKFKTVNVDELIDKTYKGDVVIK